MRVERTVVVNRADIKKLVGGEVLYVEIDGQDRPLPIVFERERKARVSREEKIKVPCPLNCGKQVIQGYGEYKHLATSRNHKKDPAVKKWIAEYKKLNSQSTQV